MSLRLEKSRFAEIFSLIALSVITIIAIVNQKISVFYIVYLLWFDEFLKTVSDFLKSRFKTKSIVDLSNYKNNVKSRFFMLGIYLVFIIVFFAILFDFKSEALLIGNFSIFTFKNPWFNFSVLAFLAREIFTYNYENSNQILVHSVVSKGIITLHLSIILGVFLWFFATRYYDNDIFDIKEYYNVIVILPFLVIKFIFEIMEINQRHKQSKTSSIL